MRRKSGKQKDSTYQRKLARRKALARSLGVKGYTSAKGKPMPPPLPMLKCGGEIE